MFSVQRRSSHIHVEQNLGLCVMIDMLNHTHCRFQWKNGALFMKITQAISRTTRPNIGLFVLILIYIPWRCQIWI